MSSTKTVWLRSPAVAFVTEGGRVVALDLGNGNGRPRLLHGGTAHIWRALDGQLTTAEIAARLRNSPSAESAALTESHILLHLAALAEAGLVMVRGQ